MSQQFLLYLLAVLTVNLFPGPDMLYIISQSLRHGKTLGLAAALGIGAGCFVHTFGVSLGLSTLLFKSALAFAIVKYLGVCYLLYLGITSLFSKNSLLLDQKDKPNTASFRKSFAQGFLTNVLNPKVAIFFLAFLPQFVNPSAHYSVGLQMILLGFIFCLSGTIVNILVAFFFGAVKQWLYAHPRTLNLQQKITGFILIGLGLKLAAFEKN